MVTLVKEDGSSIEVPAESITTSDYIEVTTMGDPFPRYIHKASTAATRAMHGPAIPAIKKEVYVPPPTPDATVRTGIKWGFMPSCLECGKPWCRHICDAIMSKHDRPPACGTEAFPDLEQLTVPLFFAAPFKKDAFAAKKNLPVVRVQVERFSRNKPDLALMTWKPLGHPEYDVGIEIGILPLKKCHRLDIRRDLGPVIYDYASRFPCACKNPYQGYDETVADVLKPVLHFAYRQMWNPEKSWTHCQVCHDDDLIPF
jgi:hypothetical protein